MTGREADFDMESISNRSLAKFGLRKAKSYYIGLHGRFAEIAKGLVHFSDYSFVHLGLKRKNYGSHAIYYKIDSNTILILRVLYQSMDTVLYIK